MKNERIFYMFDPKDEEKDICIKTSNYFSEEKVISDLDVILLNVDENDSFSSLVLYYLKSKHLTTKELYDRAYIDRRLFHKIIKNRRYHPSKKTVLSLCIALELNHLESMELLGLAGYSFASNSRSDMIFLYFVSRNIYDIDIINSVLYHYDCSCIGD